MRAEVVGVVVAVREGTPLVLATGNPPQLPAGPLLSGEPSLQRSTRAWVEEQTGLRAGYLEQLYTFADAGRDPETRVVSVSYLGLTAAPEAGEGWLPWYDVLPWEDHRDGHGEVAVMVERLLAWAEASPGEIREHRRARVEIAFGARGREWHPDLALQRYELLYEAALIPEAPGWPGEHGQRMSGDHRRMLATGIARLRAKIEYRPVVFELLPEEFTLSELQRCVEAIAGQAVHTQNFRRTVEAQELVEETGRAAATGGRPAKQFRFRRSVLQERQAAGTKLPIVRTR